MPTFTLFMTIIGHLFKLQKFQRIIRKQLYESEGEVFYKLSSQSKNTISVILIITNDHWGVII